MSVYRSFIFSLFEYCPVVWIFCTKGNSKKLERIQERALRIIFKDYTSSYDTMLQRSNMLSLDLLRLKHLAVEMYKCVHGMNPAYLNDTFSIKETAYDLRDTSVMNQNSFKTRTYGYRSFAYYGSKLWNCLPNARSGC